MVQSDAKNHIISLLCVKLRRKRFVKQDLSGRETPDWTLAA